MHTTEQTFPIDPIKQLTKIEVKDIVTEVTRKDISEVIKLG